MSRPYSSLSGGDPLFQPRGHTGSPQVITCTGQRTRLLLAVQDLDPSALPRTRVDAGVQLAALDAKEDQPVGALSESGVVPVKDAGELRDARDETAFTSGSPLGLKPVTVLPRVGPLLADLGCSLSDDDLAPVVLGVRPLP